MKRFLITLIITAICFSANAQFSARVAAMVAYNDSVHNLPIGTWIEPINEQTINDTLGNLLNALYATLSAGGNLETVTTAGNVTDQGIGVIPSFFTPPGFDGIYILPDNTIQWPYIAGGHLYNGYLTYVPLGGDTKVYLPYEPANNPGDIPQSTLVTHRTKDEIEVSTGSGGTYNAGYLGVGFFQWGHAGSEHGFLGYRDFFVSTGGGGAGYDVIGSMLTMKDKTLTGTGTILSPNAVFNKDWFYFMPADSGYIAIQDDSIGGKGQYPRIATKKQIDSITTSVIVPPNLGGTGIANNVLSTWKITGSFPTTVNVTAATNVTLPITGTLYGTRTGSITSAQLLNSLTDATGTNHAVFSDNPLFNGTVTLTDPTNFIFGATTGTKFGTGTTQKMGWWNSTPVIQQTGDIVTALQLYGLVASPSISVTNVTGVLPAGNGGTGNGITTVAGTSYTLLAADWGHTIICTSASSVTLTVPAGLPAGFVCNVVQAGAGLITPTASGTTLDNGDGYTKSAGIKTAFTILYVGTNEYLMQGRMGL